MRFLPTAIPGLVDILAEPRPDDRGRLVKTFVRAEYEAAGLPVDFAEGFYSYSREGVLRALHFQLPPSTQAKTVFCDHGAIFDAVLDLRVGSPWFGRALTFELSAENGRGLYIPEGLAHGFCVIGHEALVSYRTTTGYAPQSDAGIKWDSAGIDWPVSKPLVSPKDASLPRLEELSSPFVYAAGSDRE